MTESHIYVLTAGQGRCDMQEEKRIESALRGGAGWLQLREKKMDAETLYAWGMILRRVTARYGAKLIVNDDVELALRIGAAGVHVGQEDISCAAARKYFPGGIVGVSCHSVTEARCAARDGADYIGAGAVFATVTKADVRTLSLTELRRMTAAVEIPVWAIGGIEQATTPQLGRCGVAGYAVASGVWNAPHPDEAVRALETIWRQNEK